VYGSADASWNLKDSKNDENLRTQLERVAACLNLAAHPVTELSTKSRKEICWPADIEVHKGTDGVVYILDLARTFPPTLPESHQRHQSIFSQVFRPEFVSRYGKPLSSDALSCFGQAEGEVFNADVAEATKYLLEVVIPEFVQSMQKESSGDRLVLRMHQKGINARYLGHMRRHSTQAVLRQVLLEEMLARVMKHDLCRVLRQQMTDLRSPNDQPYADTCKGFLSHLIEDDGSFEPYRNLLVSKFGSIALNHEEQTESFNLLYGIRSKSHVLFRCAVLVGIELADHVDMTFPLQSADVKLVPRVKEMSITSVSMAETARRESKFQHGKQKVQTIRGGLQTLTNLALQNGNLLHVPGCYFSFKLTFSNFQDAIGLRLRVLRFKAYLLRVCLKEKMVEEVPGITKDALNELEAVDAVCGEDSGEVGLLAAKLYADLATDASKNDVIRAFECWVFAFQRITKASNAGGECFLWPRERIGKKVRTCRVLLLDQLVDMVRHLKLVGDGISAVEMIASIWLHLPELDRQRIIVMMEDDNSTASDLNERKDSILQSRRRSGSRRNSLILATSAHEIVDKTRNRNMWFLVLLARKTDCELLRNHCVEVLASKDVLKPTSLSFPALTVEVLEIFLKFCPPSFSKTLDLSGIFQISASDMLRVLAEHSTMPLSGLSLRGLVQLDKSFLEELLESCPRLRSTLKTLDLAGTSFEGKLVTISRSGSGGEFLSLSDLLLDACPLEDAVLKTLQPSLLPSLRSLSLSFTDISSSVLEYLVSVFPKLISINLDYCRKITAAGLLSIGKLKFLQKVSLSNLRALDLRTARRMIGGLSELEYLNVSGCRQLSGTLLKLFKGSTKLSTLELGGVPLGQDGGLALLAADFSSLSFLGIVNCGLPRSLLDQLVGKYPFCVFEQANATSSSVERLVRESSMIDREAELSLFQKMMSEAEQMIGSVMVLEGENGVGKSTLLRGLKDATAFWKGNVLPIFHTAGEGGQSLVESVLLGCFGSAGYEGRAIAQRLGSKSSVAEGEADMLTALGRFGNLADLAVVVFLDDAHLLAAGEDDLFLAKIVANPPERCLFVLASAPAPSKSWFSKALDSAKTSFLELLPYGVDYLRNECMAIFGMEKGMSDTLEDGWFRKMNALANGVFFFRSLLVDHYLAHGTLQDVSYVHLLMDRLDALPRILRFALDAAAVLCCDPTSGLEINPYILADVVGKPRDTIGNDLEQLKRHGFVVFEKSGKSFW
jgi:hypothetical protein